MVLPAGFASALAQDCVAAWLFSDQTARAGAWLRVGLRVKRRLFLAVSRPGSVESSRNPSSDSSPLNLKGRSAFPSARFTAGGALGSGLVWFLWFENTTHRRLRRVSRLHPQATSCRLRLRPESFDGSGSKSRHLRSSALGSWQVPRPLNPS